MCAKIESGTSSVPEAAAQTGLDRSAVPDAIASGLLSGVEMNGRMRVTLSSIERFNAEYVPLSQIARNLRASTRGLLRICRTAGLETVSLRRTDSAVTQPILPRSLIDQLAERREGERHVVERNQKAHRERLCKDATRKYLREL